MLTSRKYQKQLADAIKRLERSEGRLARKRARLNLRSTLRSIERDLLPRFPELRRDGAVVPPAKKPRGRVCPLCNSPMRTVSTLSRHLLLTHVFHKTVGGELLATCWCGAQFSASISSAGFETIHKSLTRHLAGVKDLRAHAAIGLLSNLSGGGT